MKQKKYWVGKDRYWYLLFALALLTKGVFVFYGKYWDDYLYVNAVQKTDFFHFLKYSVTGYYFRPVFNVIVYVFLKLFSSLLLLRLFGLGLFMCAGYLWYKILSGEGGRKLFLLLLLSPIFLESFLMAVGIGDIIFYFIATLAIYFFYKDKDLLGALSLALLFFVKENAVLVSALLLILFRRRRKSLFYILMATLIALAGFWVVKSSIYSGVGSTVKFIYLPHIFVFSIVLTLLPVVPSIDLVNFVLQFFHPTVTFILFVLVGYALFRIAKQYLGYEDGRIMLFLVLLLLFQTGSFWYLKVNPIISYRNLLIYHMPWLILIATRFKERYYKLIVGIFFIMNIIFISLSLNARVFYKANLLLVPKSPAIHLTLAAQYFREGAYEQAAMEYRQVLKEDRDNEKALWGLFRSLEKERKYIDARRVIFPIEQKALKDKDYKTLGRIYEKIAPYISEQYYRKAGDYKKLGDKYFFEQEYDSALQYYRKELDKGFNVDAALKTGYILQKKGKYTEARAIYQAILKYEPLNKFAMNNLGIIEAIKGNYELARSYFKKALEIDPNYQDAKKNLKKVRQYLK